MFEVEAKVPIGKREFQLLYKRLQTEAQFLGTVVSADTYYTAPKTAYMRIRKRGGDNSFDLKRRQTINGIESNIEMSWKLNDLTQWEKLLKNLKITPYTRKSKKSLRYTQNNFIIELNHVRLLGYYLEVERVVKGESEVKKTKSELITLFKNLGYRKDQFEPKPYLELLANV